MMDLLIKILVLAFLLRTLYLLIKKEAIYIPTEFWKIRKMLKIANANEKDILIDLGSGDGRILFIASKEFKVKKAIGIEKSLILYLISKLLAKILKVKNVEIINADFHKIKFEKFKPTIITMYLNEAPIKKLQNRFLKMKNVKIISFAHEIPALKKFLKLKVKTGHFYSYYYFKSS